MAPLTLRILLAVVLAGCGSGASDEPPRATGTPRATTAAATLSADPLDQMVIAFEGGHSRAAIKAAADEALTLFGLERTTENYTRLGDALVASRKYAFDQGCERCTEMAILKATIDSHVPGLKMSLPDAIGFATAALILEIE